MAIDLATSSEAQAPSRCAFATVIDIMQTLQKKMERAMVSCSLTTSITSSTFQEYRGLPLLHQSSNPNRIRVGFLGIRATHSCTIFMTDGPMCYLRPGVIEVWRIGLPYVFVIGSPCTSTTPSHIHRQDTCALQDLRNQEPSSFAGDILVRKRISLYSRS